MPIEIKELSIKLKVNQNQNELNGIKNSLQVDDIDIEQIVENCVEKVLEELQDREER